MIIEIFFKNLDKPYVINFSSRATCDKVFESLKIAKEKKIPWSNLNHYIDTFDVRAIRKFD